MRAWYDSRLTEKSKLTRGGEMIAAGAPIEFPPAQHAGFLIQCANECGISRPGGDGAVPLTALELSSWAQSTMTELGAIDFQDLLDTSRAYIATRHEFDGQFVPPPWQPELSEEQERKAAEAEERYFDKLMGVRAPTGSDQTKGT